MELTIGLAFIAGLISFISPCVLPLVPAYVGYMGGRVTSALAQTVKTEPQTKQPTVPNNPLSIVIHGLFFVAGFTFIFVAIGLLSTAFIQYIGGSNISLITSVIGRVGGIVIIFFGLHFMGVIPALLAKVRTNHRLLGNPAISIVFTLGGILLIIWSLSGALALQPAPLWMQVIMVVLMTTFVLWFVLGGAFSSPETFWQRVISAVERAFYSDMRRQMIATTRKGYGSSAMMGAIFSAGWTPCIGPIYGAILTVAANGGDAGQAGVLLTAYSPGLGLPFLFTALMLDRAQGILRRLRAHMRIIELASGAFLIFIGITVASGQLQSLSQQFGGQFAEFSIGLEETVIGSVTGGSEESTSVSSEAVEEPQDTAALQVGLEVGNLAPDFETITETGEPISLSDLRGQIVLLNFWATWCGPCRIEMPEFHRQFERHSNDGFTILAVNNSETAEDLAGFREEFGLTFPLGMDEDSAIQKQFSIFSYPSTFVIDRNGVILARHFGPLTAEQIEHLLNQALAS